MGGRGGMTSNIRSIPKEGRILIRPSDGGATGPGASRGASQAVT